MLKRSSLDHSKTRPICPVLGWLIRLIQRKLNQTSLDRFIKKRVIKIFYSCQHRLVLTILKPDVFVRFWDAYSHPNTEIEEVRY
jgi:hypothetical protein